MARPGLPGIDWHRLIDAYCERASAAFWAEPINALTNLAFLVVALGLAILLWRTPAARQAPSLWLLVLLVATIGVGSFLFHTFATAWAAAADVAPIVLFMHLYAACFARWVLGLPWRWAWLGAPLFFALARTVGWVVQPGTLGMGGYLPALLALGGFALWCVWRGLPQARGYALAAAVFAVSLAFRQADGPLCSWWPWGTHFIWHLLNAVTLGLAVALLIPISRATGESAGGLGRVPWMR